MIIAADFVEVERGACYPLVEGYTHKARYFMRGKKYGTTSASDRPEYEISKVATAIGTLVQYTEIRSGMNWETVRPSTNAEV